MKKIYLLVLFSASVACADDGALPEGWSVETVQGKDERIFYYLKPSDGRKGQMVSEAVYERLMAGDMTAEAAYKSVRTGSFLREGETVQGNYVMPDPIYSTAISDQQPDSYKQKAATRSQVQRAEASGASSLPNFTPQGTGSAPAAQLGGGFTGGVAGQPVFPGVPGSASGVAAQAGGAVSGGGQAGSPVAGAASVSVNGSPGGVATAVAVGQGGGQVSDPNVIGVNRGNNVGTARPGGGAPSSGFAGRTVGTAEQAGQPRQYGGTYNSGGRCTGNSNGATCNYDVGDNPTTYANAVDQAAADGMGMVGAAAGGFHRPQQQTQQVNTSNGR